MNGKIAIMVVFGLLLLAGTSTAAEDIVITPDDNPILYSPGVNLNSYPPIVATYTGWNTGVYADLSPMSIWKMWVVRNSDAAEFCHQNGGISADPLVISPDCVISDDEEYTLYVEGYCPRGACLSNPKFSKRLTIDAGLDPVPEMSTGILMSVGMIGLVGLTRYRRKE